MAERDPKETAQRARCGQPFCNGEEHLLSRTSCFDRCINYQPRKPGAGGGGQSTGVEPSLDLELLISLTFWSFSNSLIGHAISFSNFSYTLTIEECDQLIRNLIRALLWRAMPHPWQQNLSDKPGVDFFHPLVERLHRS